MDKMDFEQPHNRAQPGKKAQGLSAAEVASQRSRFGENRLPEEAGMPAWKILVKQIRSPLVYIIMFAALFSLALQEYDNFIIIMVVVIADLILGFFQERQARRTYTSLKDLLHPKTMVLRDGKRQEIEAWELVPGDIVLLKSGDIVPGDGWVIESIRLAMDESNLTGESEPVIKEIDNGVFMGATVVTGRGIISIDKTGTETELGKIAASLGEQDELDTPFQVRLKAFSKILTGIILGFTAGLLLVGILMGRPFLSMFQTVIILAVAAVPEGLLIAVTVILVLGMRKVLNRKGLVKELHAVETLGSVTVICTDKTGTLTEGLMRVSKESLTNEARALEAMVFCNNLEGPVDIALWQYAEQRLEIGPQAMFEQSVRLAEELFSSETKYMITHMTGGQLEDANIFFLKGAPEIVMDMCRMQEEQRREILEQVEQWAAEGLRLLGLAFRSEGTIEERVNYSWVGLVGMEDPIREGVVESVRAAQEAGIQIKIITGDYRGTAEKVGTSIGLQIKDSQTLEGFEISKMSDEKLREMVGPTKVFTRIRPKDKYRIIEALQANGEITAMVGDGVNDSLALKRANIGVVVGTAADVAKETADLILLDNDFSTIVAAIEEGRIIFSNVQKSVAFMLSNSFAEVLTILAAILLNWPTPLLVAQILWIHLICDGPADIVLGFEQKEEGVMKEKPRTLKEPILTKMGFLLICVISVLSAVFSLFIFNYIYELHQSVAEGRSVVFASLAVNSMVYIFAYRSMERPVYQMNKLGSNKPLILAVIGGLLTIAIAFWIPGLRTLLGLVSLTMVEWAIVIGFAFVLLLTVEIVKALHNLSRG